MPPETIAPSGVSFQFLPTPPSTSCSHGDKGDGKGHQWHTIFRKTPLTFVPMASLVGPSFNRTSSIRSYGRLRSASSRGRLEECEAVVQFSTTNTFFGMAFFMTLSCTISPLHINCYLLFLTVDHCSFPMQFSPSSTSIMPCWRPLTLRDLV